jgi:hypothetical protein
MPNKITLYSFSNANSMNDIVFFNLAKAVRSYKSLNI